ncbi:MAG: hypothetical protein JW728_01465 [Candidatus Aureabacteria bacterium]|nr:hypothetical protein [Candidatus Auribacterota bacterium]
MDIDIIIQIFSGFAAFIILMVAFYKSVKVNAGGYKTLILIIGLCIASIIMAAVAVYFSALGPEKTVKGHILEQKKELYEVSEAISKLQRYIEEQNILLSQAKETISQLEKKKHELAPLVEADDKTIDIVAKIHENDLSARMIRERLIGAFIGIAGLILIVIFVNITRFYFKK